MKTKSELRQHFKTISKSWIQAELQAREERLNSHLQQLLSSARGTWSAYKQIPVEPDISGTLQKTSHIKWAFPVIGENGLKFFAPEGAQNFVKNKLGVLEPHLESAAEVSLEDLEGVVVPALAFDRNGYRLGRGGGYYDRTLSRFKGNKIGVVFSMQIHDKNLPREDHDVAMDFVVTDEEVITCHKNAAIGQSKGN